MRLNTTEKKKLTAYFRERCPYRYAYQGADGYYCKLKYDQRCNHQGTFFIDYPDCPDTCPHHIRTLKIGCDEHTPCGKLDAEIKDLKEFLEN